MENSDPLDSVVLEQFFWFFFSAGFVFLVGDASIRLMFDFPAQSQKYRRLLANAASACGIVYWLFILLLLTLPTQSLILRTLSQVFLFASLWLANVSRAPDVSNLRPWNRFQEALVWILSIVVVCSGPVVIVLNATTHAPRMPLLASTGVATTQSVADFSTTSIWVILAWKAQGRQKRRALFQTLLRLGIAPFGIFWMLYPLPSTQWHLRHNVQGLILFELTHLCWSTLGTEGWGCFTVIFKGGDVPNPPSLAARNCRPQDDRLRLVENQSGEAQVRRTERDNTEAGTHDGEDGECISQGTTSCSVSHMTTWRKESHATSAGNLERQSSEGTPGEGQDKETGEGHQMAIQWTVTQQVEARSSQEQEDTKRQYCAWIESPENNGSRVLRIMSEQMRKSKTV